MPESCCSTTEDGNAVCNVSAAGQSCGYSDSAQVNSKFVPLSSINDKPPKKAKERSKLRSIVLFGIACLTNPCCTPLYVPLVLSLLAGTPAALWMSQHLGWIYGGLTLISAVSIVLGLRWMNSGKNRRPNIISFKSREASKSDNFTLSSSDTFSPER